MKKDEGGLGFLADSATSSDAETPTPWLRVGEWTRRKMGLG
jgi:hypothetical protein